MHETTTSSAHDDAIIDAEVEGMSLYLELRAEMREMLLHT